MKRLIAVLASHNRCEKTISCLRAFFDSPVDGLKLSAVLVDDGSTDGTGSQVAAQFGQRVTVIRGSGSLFWNGGMRLGMTEAMKFDPDFVLWLNDDTELEEGTLERLKAAYGAAAIRSDQVIIVGSIRDPLLANSVSYGGLYRAKPLQRTKWERLPVSAHVQECETMNGNCVLIPRAVLQTVGNLSQSFTHSMGDLDYGLRARALGVLIIVAPGTAGVCSRNSARGTFEDSAAPLAARWKHLVSIKGLPPGEWAIFTRRHAGQFWSIYWAWPYVRVLLSGVLNWTHRKDSL